MKYVEEHRCKNIAKHSSFWQSVCISTVDVAVFSFETLREKTLVFLIMLLNYGGVKKHTNQLETECIIVLGWTSIHFHINYDFQFLALVSTVASLTIESHV